MVDEERYEADARHWLDSVDAPPPRLEIAQIVQTGRSQARRRRLLTAGGGVAAALAATAAVPAMVSPLLGDTQQPAAAPCDVSDMEVSGLPVPEAALAVDSNRSNVDVQIAGVDPTGRYVVGNGVIWSEHESSDGTVAGRSGTGETTGMILWDEGRPTFIPNPPGESRTATDVNGSGVVIGGSGGSAQDPWVYRQGEVTDLPAPTNYRQASAQAINTSGDVAGTAMDDDGHVVVVIWPAEQLDQPIVLTEPAFGATVHGITEDGLVVGGIETGTPIGNGETLMTSSPHLWTEAGDGRNLELPSGVTGADMTSIGGDWAVGLAWRPASGDSDRSDSSMPADMSPVPVRWDVRTGAVEELDTGNPSLLRAEAVSAAGDVVMISWDLSEIALFRDGRAFRLPDPAESGAGEQSNPDSNSYLDREEAYERFRAQFGDSAEVDLEFGRAEPHAAVISDDGTVIVTVANLHASYDTFPVMWRC
jgi:hypothetical protein